MNINQSDYNEQRRSPIESKPKAIRYAWVGQTRAGEFVSGSYFGDSKDAVRAKLEQRGIVAQRIIPRRGGRRRMVNEKDVLQFLQELAVLYESGVPLIKALDLQAHSQRNNRFKFAILDMKFDIERGESLHNAFRHHPEVFDEVTCNLIASGESSGRLADVLGGLVSAAERRSQLKQQIKTALWYPSFVIIVALMIWMAMLTFVVPVFEGIYRSQGKQLPVLTEAMILFSHGVRDYWFLYVIVLAALGYWVWRQFQNGMPLWFDRFRMKIPVIGDLLMVSWHAQFSRTLGLLYESGIPLHQALSTAGKTISSRIMQMAIEDSRIRVLNGESLALSMSHHAIFDKSFVQRIQIGEESGSIGRMLSQHAKYNEFIVEQRIKRLSALLEPLMILVIGLLVVVMVVALYLPILDISTTV